MPQVCEAVSGGLSSLRGHSYVGAGVTTVGELTRGEGGAIAVGALVGDLGWRLAEVGGRQTQREPAEQGGA
ncbi:hypothetical protein Sm713_69140 [Streptomyces sp. TS71-3]|nr:hypothetical protein Sm713_69140 [Streptomyces sp. TS71-3]